MNKTRYNLITLRQTARLLPADMETPISLFMGMAGTGEGILLESAAVDGRWGRYSILACDMILYVFCKDGMLNLKIKDDRLSSLKKLEGMPFQDGLRALLHCINIEAPKEQNLPPITRALYGYFGFEMAGLFNPKLAATMPRDEAECCLALPGTVIVFDHVYNRLCQVSLDTHREVRSAHETSFFAGGKEFRPTDVVFRPNQTDFVRSVEQIRCMLSAGEAIQVVPSVRFSIPCRNDGFTLYRRLRRYNASPYMFYMHLPEITLFGSSPEVMVRCAQNELSLSPIAGTRKRGRDDKEDRELEQDLLSDPKERAEHVMLVDLGRNDLGRIAEKGSVHVDRLMQIERFSHVMHLTSQVSAKLSSGLDAVDVLAATFPAGTVSGAPKIRAMEIIRDIEGCPRGPYAGCIGWFGFDNKSVNLDTGITIRSMWMQKGKLFWQAGAGIVHDSVPELEWKEVMNKTAILRLALQMEDGNHVSINR